MQAEALGQQDALRVAGIHLGARRTAMLKEIHRAQASGSLGTLRALRADAAALGLSDALQSVDALLRTHAAAAQQRLSAAAAACTSAQQFASAAEVRAERSLAGWGLLRGGRVEHCAGPCRPFWMLSVPLCCCANARACARECWAGLCGRREPSHAAARVCAAGQRASA